MDGAEEGPVSVPVFTIAVLDMYGVCYLDCMHSGEKTDSGAREVLKGLLGRGGASLTLAVASRWAVENGEPEVSAYLLPELRAAAAQAGKALDANPPDDVLEEALACALRPRPAVTLPDWVKTVVRNPREISRIGQRFSGSLHAALGVHCPSPSARERGLAALALSLCRQQDTLRTLADFLPVPAEGVLLERMARLAAVLASPGEPSSARAAVRRILKGAE